MRPRHLVAADLSTIGRRAAEEGNPQPAGRLLEGNLRAAETERVDHDWAKVTPWNWDSQTRRRVEGVGLFDRPKFAIPYFVSNKCTELREQQEPDADRQDR